MDLSHNEEQNIYIVTVEGALAGSEILKLRPYVTKLIEAGTPKAIILNLQDTIKIDSAGLGAITNIFQITRQREIGFALIEPDAHINQTLADTLLGSVIPTHKTKEEALVFLEV
ncbi:MAG: anti-sigma factor antagonist [SAR324 cluster bacterium]|nr:anti-sigma factor antagonist [SAR324 cluster bacterium]